MNLVQTIKADIDRSRPRKGSAVAYDRRGVHTLITEHANGMLRAACTCRWTAGEQRRDYADVRADHEQHRTETSR